MIELKTRLASRRTRPKDCTQKEKISEDQVKGRARRLMDALNLEDGKDRDGHANARRDPVDMRVARPGKDEAPQWKDYAGSAGTKEPSFWTQPRLVAAM